MKCWTHTQAVQFAVNLEQALSPLGYHVGLTGGCLYARDNAVLRKDADIIIYPHGTVNGDRAEIDPDKILPILRKMGFEDKNSPQTEEISSDLPRVWCAYTPDGDSVDFFLLD